MLLSGVCCLITGMIAFLTSHMPGDPRSTGAFRTSRVMAVFGGVCAMAGGLTGLPYHWLVGDIDLQTFLAIEGGLVVVIEGVVPKSSFERGEVVHEMNART